VLVLPKERLVFLANPKTATQSLRAMLKPHATDWQQPDAAKARHMGIGGFQAKWAEILQDTLGGPVETFAVVREPMARLDSWYRYRKRNPKGTPSSSKGISLENFCKAGLAARVPPYAKIGSQAKFVGFDGLRAQVDYLFDYDQMDLLLTFLSDRIGRRVSLPRRNISVVPRDDAPLAISPETLAALHEKMAADFALYDRVRETGVVFRDE
jgi:hypothetical protein